MTGEWVRLTWLMSLQEDSLTSLHRRREVTCGQTGTNTWAAPSVRWSSWTCDSWASAAPQPHTNTSTTPDNKPRITCKREIWMCFSQECVKHERFQNQLLSGLSEQRVDQSVIHQMWWDISVTLYFKDQFSLLTSCLLTCILIAYWPFIDTY